MFQTLIEKRRSVRKFKDKAIEEEKIDQLVEAALRAPSSRGINAWEFIVITDPALIQKLSKTKAHGSAFLKNAALAFVVCGDSEKSDVWIENASIATIYLHLAATDLGLASCWIQIRNRAHDEDTSAESYIQNLLDIPSHLKVLSMVAVGYASEEKPGHSKSDLDFHRVSYNGFGKKR